MGRGRLVVEIRRVDRQSLQPGPGEHPKVFGVAASQVVDVADNLRNGVGPHPERGEVLPAVSGDDVAKQRLLVAEVRIQPLLACPRGSGNPVDARPCQPVLSELGAGGGKNVVAQLCLRSHRSTIAKRTSSSATLVGGSSTTVKGDIG